MPVYVSHRVVVEAIGQIADGKLRTKPEGLLQSLVKDEDLLSAEGLDTRAYRVQVLHKDPRLEFLVLVESHNDQTFDLVGHTVADELGKAEEMSQRRVRRRGYGAEVVLPA